MSQNNTIKKSDKKFIRNEKARIRAQFLDLKKQEELINNLYKKFLPQVKTEESKKEEKAEAKVEPKKVEVKKEEKKVEVKKEKVVKKAK